MPMYLDLSLRRVFPLLIVIAILFSAVAVTFAIKNVRYGSTPFYAAVGLTLQEATTYPTYSLELAFERFVERVRAALGFAQAEQVFTVAPGQAAGIPVLAYHRLVAEPDGINVTVAHFETHMEALKADGWRSMTLAEMEGFLKRGEPLPAKTVLITFDDGTKQSYYPVDPVLRAHGYTAATYIIVNASELEESTYYQTTAEVRQMLKTGRWEIGSHSVVGHQPYAIDASGTEGHFFSDRLWLHEEGRLETPDEFRARVAADLAESKRRLEATFGVPVQSFAFPFGDAGEFSKNFPESTDIVVEEAAKVYDYGFVQVGRAEYSYNYPDPDAFLVRRIKIDPAWDGEALLAALARGIGKDLPYRDDLAEDRGWISSWGSITHSEGLLVAASATSSGAAAFLDGTRHWRDYESVAHVEWRGGFALAMGAVAASDTYRSCVFSDGHVRLQRVIGDERTVLADRDDASIQRGNRTLGIRVQDDATQCLFDGRVVLSATGLPETQGGIGFQVWSETPGSASMTVQSIEVRDVSAEALPRGPAAAASAEAPAQAMPAIPATGAAPAPEQAANPIDSAETAPTGFTVTISPPPPSASETPEEATPTEPAPRTPPRLDNLFDRLPAEIRDFFRDRRNGDANSEADEPGGDADAPEEPRDNESDEGPSDQGAERRGENRGRR